MNVIVVGAGQMGSNHIRTLKRIPGVAVAAVIDRDVDRASLFSDQGQIGVFADVESCLRHVGEIDAAVIASPTAFHFSQAKLLLQARIPVLVEKPIASNSTEANELVDLATSKSVVFAVGHIERHNAAVRELLRIATSPIHFEARRIGPFSPRISDSVVADLMIHDVDIALALANCECIKVSGVAASAKSQLHDTASAVLEFENGMVATLTASRIGQQKIRYISVTEEEKFIEVDLLKQDLSITQVAHTEFAAEDGMRYRQSASVEIPFLPSTGEPLLSELSNFLAAVKGNEEVTCNGFQGLQALKTVERILGACNQVK